MVDCVALCRLPPALDQPLLPKLKEEKYFTGLGVRVWTCVLIISRHSPHQHHHHHSNGDGDGDTVAERQDGSHGQSKCQAQTISSRGLSAVPHIEQRDAGRASQMVRRESGTFRRVQRAGESSPLPISLRENVAKGQFTSGMMPSSQSPSPRKAPPSSTGTHLSTPIRGRRRSSILASPSSPAAYKSGGLDGGVERALDSVMRSLKIAMSTPRTPRMGEVREESRWSSSTGSPASLVSTSESFWRSRKSGESARPRKSGESARPLPRKSGESIRSRMTARSGVSKKGRKSGETERGVPMEVDVDVVPPVPATPRRSVVGDLARRLGLTPKRRFA